MSGRGAHSAGSGPRPVDSQASASASRICSTFSGVERRVGVLDAQHQLASGMARQQARLKQARYARRPMCSEPVGWRESEPSCRTRRGPPLEHSQAAARDQAAKAVGLAEQAPLPMYAHLPAAARPDGKKLSKRHGAACVRSCATPLSARGGPQLLALLGWGAGDDATILSTDELVRRSRSSGSAAKSGALRRGEAAVAERRLHSRAAGAELARRWKSSQTGRISKTRRG